MKINIIIRARINASIFMDDCLFHIHIDAFLGIYLPKERKFGVNWALQNDFDTRVKRS